MVVGQDVLQLGVGGHLRPYAERRSSQFLDDKVGTEIETHAGLGLNLNGGAEEVELVLHDFTAADAAETAIVLKASPELGGNVVTDADVGIAFERGGKLQIDAGSDGDAYRHRTYREDIFDSGELYEVYALLVFRQRNLLGEADRQLRVDVQVAIDIGLQIGGYGDADGLDAALGFGLDGVVEIEHDGAVEVDANGVFALLAAREFLLQRQLGVGMEKRSRLLAVDGVGCLRDYIVHSRLNGTCYLLGSRFNPVSEVVEDAVAGVLAHRVEFRDGEGLVQVVRFIPVAVLAVAAVVGLSIERDSHRVDYIVIINIHGGLEVAECRSAGLG